MNIKPFIKAVYSALRFKKSLPMRPRITLGLSSRCNIRCVFCLAHSPLIADGQERFCGMTWQLGKPNAGSSVYLEFKKFKEIIDSLRDLQPASISLSGNGEILLYPHLLSAVSYTRSKLNDIHIDLSTNGLNLNSEMSREMLRMEIDQINFSINAADAQTYEQMHCIKSDTFYDVINNIKNLVSEKQRLGKNKPRISATFVICRKNFHQLKGMINLCFPLGIKNAGFRNMYFCKGKENNLKEYILNPGDKIKLKDYILDALLEAKNKKIFTNLSSFFKISEKGGNDKFLPKASDAYDCQIHPDGTVNAYDFPYRMGNVYENNISQIWHSPQYLNFRDMIKEKASKKEHIPTRPFCFRCNLPASQLADCNIIF